MAILTVRLSAMNREVLDRWCERAILGLGLAILIFGPLAMGAVDTVPFLVIQGLTISVVLLWGARLWLSERPRLLWPPVCWAVVAFTAYAVVRYLTADIEYVARQELIRVLIYAFVFFATLNNLNRQRSVQIASLALIFLAMGISCYAIYQFLSGSDRVWNLHTPYKHQGTGTYISPNSLGGFLEILLPLSLAYALTSRLKPLAKVFVGYAALMIGAGIVVTGSRGACLSTAAALLFFFGVLAFNLAFRLPALVFMVVIIGAAMLFIPKLSFFKHRFHELVMGGLG